MTKHYRIQMRTIQHQASGLDRMDPATGGLFRCECGKSAVTMQELAKKHQRSQRVVPGFFEIESEN
jgi:hypothetical protein